MKIYEIYEDETAYYILTELMLGKSLSDYIKDNAQGKLTEAKAAEVMIQVLSGLNCCHIQNIVHRDIKLENLMFSDAECTNLKLIDFGFGKFMKGKSRGKEFLGSPMYMAPEILTQQRCNEKCDIWSCGILCYIIVSGNLPFEITESGSIDPLYKLIKNKEFTKDDFSGPEWNKISEGAKDFILTLLQKDPLKRPKAGKCLTHRWLASARGEKMNLVESRKIMKRLQDINVMILIIELDKTYLSAYGGNVHGI